MGNRRLPPFAWLTGAGAPRWPNFLLSLRTRLPRTGSRRSPVLVGGPSGRIPEGPRPQHCPRGEDSHVLAAEPLLSANTRTAASAPSPTFRRFLKATHGVSAFPPRMPPWSRLCAAFRHVALLVSNTDGGPGGESEGPGLMEGRGRRVCRGSSRRPGRVVAGVSASFRLVRDPGKMPGRQQPQLPSPGACSVPGRHEGLAVHEPQEASRQARVAGTA